ncbi:AVAST type 1 anti-phage system protein Avs1c [Comamonas testosteroni]|uniref:AVAST type 1 anti-phage system protein Avs1c n=1 Tax=Comamonas testosteroni TaxID=285 RepID=UPI000AE168DF|nr:AVAST type 1 anti-phage system protein Avs1c [Comamonas testosteroni]
MPPKLTTMQTPMSRGAFEERLNLVHEHLESGKMHPQGMEGMLNVRLLPNGRIDMLSIDEMVRLHANTVYQMEATDMGKKLRRMAELGKGANDAEGDDDEF